MNDQALVHQLKRLRNRVVQLQAEFQYEHLDKGLFAEIETLMEGGVAADRRCTELRDLVDGLREHTLLVVSADHKEAVRRSQRLKTAIESVISDLVT